MMCICKQLPNINLWDKISHRKQPSWRKFQKVYAREQKELTHKPDGNCPFSSTGHFFPKTKQFLFLQEVVLICVQRQWMGTTLWHVWAAVTRWLLLNQGLMHLNKEVPQPHPAIMCCTGGANVGRASLTWPSQRSSAFQLISVRRNVTCE